MPAAWQSDWTVIRCPFSTRLTIVVFGKIAGSIFVTRDIY
jgi:hypothetical protein